MILKCVSTDHQWWPSWNITVVRMKLEWSLIVAYQSLYQNLHKVMIFGVWLGNIPILWEKHVGNCKVFQPLHNFKMFFPPSSEPHRPSAGATYCCFSSFFPRRHWWPEQSKHHKHDAVQRTWSQSPQTTSIPPLFGQIAPRRSDCFRFSALVKL